MAVMGSRNLDAPPRDMAARRMARLGVALSVAPWLLIGPLAIYRMDFMLWTWIWPGLLGLAGAGAGALALRLDARGGGAWARAAVELGLVALAVALLGFGLMLAGMGGQMRM
jgi:hypothetical protein